MAQIRRATIAAEVSQKIDSWLENASHYMDPESWEFKSLFRSAEKLANASPFEGVLDRAFICSLAGDSVGAAKWFRDLQSWPGRRPQIIAYEVVVLSNLGLFSKAAELQKQLHGLSPYPGNLNVDLLCGNFGAIPNIVEGMQFASDAAKADVLAVVDTARRSIMALQNLRLNEEQVQAVLDLAGEVLRSHRMFFSGDRPFVHAISDGLLYQLEVRADVATTMEMTDEVHLKMVERHLDLPGLAFSFIPK